MEKSIKGGLMRRIYLKNILFVIIFCLISSFCIAEESDIDKQLSEIYKKAEQAIEENNMEEADFWLARYMGLTFINEDTERSIIDLYTLLANHNVSKPTSVISGIYSDGFIEWFNSVAIVQWGLDDDEDYDEETLSSGIISNANEEYFATIIASPYIEGWFLTKDGQTKTLIMPLIDSMRKPTLTAGKHKKSVPKKLFEEIEIDTGGHPIQYIWPIEFHDLDGDKVSEMWVRYNQTWGTGFSQVLDIYKIEKDEKLVLFKRFEGLAEGIARRLDDGKIEVAKGFGDSGHMGYDQHHFEIWEYKNGEFVKISEKNVPHILWTDEWEKYYFE